jgi:hypothetical protein
VIFLSNRVHPDGKGLVNPLIARIASAAVAAIVEPRAQPQAASDRPVLTGIDVLVRDGFRPLAGKRVAVITNHTGRDGGGRSTASLLAKADNVQLVAIFGRVDRQSFRTWKGEAFNIEARAVGQGSCVVVVGAHYDSAIGTPGADDNASGVGAMIELSRRFATRPAPCATRWVAWTNEEQPWFQDEGQGSLEHARALRAEGVRVAAVYSLETLGWYDDRENTQVYPFPMGLIYPAVGNFVAFVGDARNVRLVRASVASFRANAPFPSEGVAAPGWIPGITWSDHAAYSALGMPAVMVTDTAMYRNPAYHTAQDRTIDAGRVARVVDGLEAVIRATR